MKHLRWILSVVIAVTLWAAGVVSQAPAGSQRSPGFETMKKLVGDWEGVADDGKPMVLTFRLISSGTALMESNAQDDPSSPMITIYHPDGADLIATHYCPDGDQPRMRAKISSANAAEIRFVFQDATNAWRTGGPLMRGLTLRMPDANHLVQEWQGVENGKPSTTVMKFTRKSSGAK